MPDDNSEELACFLRHHERLAVLTGAGCSTASGIPEYRDDLGEWKHAQPVQFADFMGSVAVRQRYWARSFSGWPRVATASPNATHQALAALSKTGRLSGLITQNVDNLHRRAGSRKVLDLHGVLEQVRCMDCADVVRRAAIQERMVASNPDWQTRSAVSLPDGDADLGDQSIADFAVPECELCGGILKPDVVFFGESVPAERVNRGRRIIADADALLVVGSSLVVFSGYRFVRQASSAGIPIAIVNRGRTRGDALATLRISGDCGEVLAAACATLDANSAAHSA